MFSTGFAFLRSEGSIPPVANLLLDDYPNAELGLSFRKLRTDYSGSCIRVRRSSDDTEQDIGFVNDYIDTAALASFCSGTNGFIKIWYDQSGNGRNSSQADTAAQPQIVTSGTVNTYNSKVCGYYNGSSSLQTSVNSYSLDFYSVHKFDTAFSQGVPMGFGIADPNWITYAFGLLQGDTLSLFLIQSEAGDTAYYPSAPSSFWGQNAWYGNYTNMEMWRNNSQLTLTISGDGHSVAPLEQVVTGKRGFEGWMTGIIQEQITYNYATSNTAITNNINTFYSIY
jgi:hypothetical protein